MLGLLAGWWLSLFSWQLGRGIPSLGMVGLAVKEAGGISRLGQEVMLRRSDGGGSILVLRQVKMCPAEMQ